MWQQATSSADVRLHLPMEAIGSCNCHQVSSLVDLVPLLVPELTAAASFHSGNEGHRESKCLDYTDLHLQFLAPCSCVPCCALWVESGNNRVAVPSQPVGLTTAIAPQGWLLKASISRLYWDGTQNSCERPMLGSWWSWRQDDFVLRVLLVTGRAECSCWFHLSLSRCLDQIISLCFLCRWRITSSHLLRTSAFPGKCSPGSFVKPSTSPSS